MMRYNQDQLDKEYRNRQEVRAERERLVQMAVESQPRKNRLAFVGHFVNRVVDVLERFEPQPTPKHREFKQKPVSSIR